MRIFEASIRYSLVRLGENISLDTPPKVVEYMAGAFDEDPTVEWFYVVMLDRRNFPIGRKVISRGSAVSTLAHPREVFKPAILASALAVICVHNHPSGDPAPSQADLRTTRQLREAAGILGIDLLDHLVIGHHEADPLGRGYYSFREAGLL